MDTKRPTIVMFEDTSSTLEMYRQLYATAGFCFIGYAYPTDNVVEEVARLRPDIISMDITMPYMDGLTAARRLKSDARTKNIPIIFLTTHDNPYDRDEASRLGAADYIVKGMITPKQVVRHVRQLAAPG